jgi:prepilin-type N-terminal cleavage/methylation domain-containing protein
MKYCSATDEYGFTLIEVIVTVLVVAIFGAMMIVFLSDSIVKSSQSVGKLKKVSDLNKVMANITQYYNQYPKWRSQTTYAAGNVVVPTTRNGHFYTCKPPGGISGTTEFSSWVTSGDTGTDGTITWTESGPLPTMSAFKDLGGAGYIGAENSDQNNAYGRYHVVNNKCITFDASYNEQDDSGSGCANNILKVTIRSDQGEALTALFIFRYL